MSDPDVSSLIPVSRAIEILDAAEVTPRTEEIALADAFGLTLAADLSADRDYPPFDKSQMDGYALWAADAGGGAPFALPLAGEIAAGSAAPGLAPGTTLAIMTGAPMPAGADSVIPIEDTRPGDGRVTFLRTPVPGHFIAPRGSDCPAGRVVLPRGTRLGPAQVSVAATIGAARLSVHPHPRAAVLSTGDELVPADQAPGPSQIRNANAPMLLALLTTLGCDAIDLGIGPDDPDTLRKTLAGALDGDVDLLFITGGMSMGAHDHAPAVLKSLGVHLLITKLRIKPGKPFLFGTGPQIANRKSQIANRPYVFGLPGNPVSAYVCTLRLAARLIARLQGRDPSPRLRPATLAADVPANGPREFYLPVRLDGSGRAVPLPWKGSADLFTLARAGGLLIRPENAPPLAVGTMVELLETP